MISCSEDYKYALIRAAKLIIKINTTVKIQNEVKVGILALISIALLFWGFNFLKGKNVLSNNYTISATFKSVDGLNIAAPVAINGYKVGAVTKIAPTPDYIGVVVTMNIDQSARVPKNARAVLVQPSLMGGKEVALKFVGDCGGNCIGDGGELAGDVSGMMDGVLEVAEPYMGKIDTLLGNITELTNDQKGQLDATFKDLQGVINNVKVLTDLVNNLMVSSSTNIAVTMSNLKQITGNIKDNNAEITGMLQNMNTITKQVKDADLEGTIGSAKSVMKSVDARVADLKTTMDKANEALANVNKLVDLSNQNGLVAALFNDPEFKGDVEETIKNVNLLVEDIRLHPERYRTVLSGKHKPYQGPK